MKIIRIFVLAFSMAILFAACGNGNGDTTKTDSTVTSATTTQPSAPKMDTPTAPLAKPDTSKPVMNK